MSELQAAMARRRKLAESGGDDPGTPEAATKGTVPHQSSPSATVSPVNEKLKGVPMSPDLQAVMDRRRKLAEGGEAIKSSSRRGTKAPPAPPISTHSKKSEASDHSSDDSSVEEEEEEEEVLHDDSSKEPEPAAESHHHHGSATPTRSTRKKRSSRRPQEAKSEDDEPSMEGSPSASPRKSPSKDSPRRRSHHRSSRRRSTGAGDDLSVDLSVDRSVDSRDSARSGSMRNSNSKSSSHRQSRRASTGASNREEVDETATSSNSRDPTSLKALSKRRMTTRPENDDYSRAESRAESRSGGGSSSSRRTKSSRRKSEAVGNSRRGSSRSDDGDGRRSKSSRRRRPSIGSTDGSMSSDLRSEDKGGRSSLENSPTKQQQQQQKTDASAGWGADFDSIPAAAADVKDAGFASFPAATAAPTEEKDAGFASGGFGAFGTEDAKVTGFVSGGFGNFASDANSGGDAFGSGGFPSTTTTTTTKDAAFSGGSDFEAAFSSPPAFDAKTTAFGSSATGFDAFGAAEFSSTPSFKPPPPATVYESSPLVDVPKKEPSKLSLLESTVFSGQLLGAPVTNPLNDNIFFCSSTADGIYIHEVDPHRDNVQVASVAVLSTELQRKLASKYNVSVHTIDSVITLTAGLHRAHGQTRVRVAALLDLQVLESQEVMRMIAFWQWGYGSPQPVTLQSVMTPPSGGNFSYDAESLQNADGLLFLAGASPKGPCVFVSKPAVKETWAANFLSGKGRVSTMAVTTDVKRISPYLAVALTDKSLSIWTYEAALGSGASKSSEASKRWLYPLCRLDCACVATSEVTSFEENRKLSGKDPKDVGQCTHLAWLPPQPALSSLQLLAASFQNGVAAFHVALPVTVDKDNNLRPLPKPTEDTQLSQTPSLEPFVANRWPGKNARTFASWLCFGPHSSLCLAVLLHESDKSGGSARVAIGAVNLSLYRKGPKTKERLAPLRVLTESTISKASDSYPLGLLRASGLKAVMCYSDERIMLLSPSTSSLPTDATISSLGYPIASNPPGLSSAGDNLFTDTADDKDGILHIYTVMFCERQKSEAGKNLLEWSRPTRRHWLCRTVVGDSKSSSVEEMKEDRGSSGFGGSEIVLGGASSDVVCELAHDSLAGLAPFRILRCQGSKICAVLFRPVLGSKGGLSLDAVSIAFVDVSADSAALLDVVEGRDVALWSEESTNRPRGVLLSRDGTSLTFFTFDALSKSVELDKSFRPVLGVEIDKNYVECRRIFAFAGASKLGLAAVGTRHRDGRTCFVTGELFDAASVTASTLSEALPNIATGDSIWFNDMEEILSVVGLECDDSGYRNFAVATSSRVMVLSSALQVSAQTKTAISCCSLSPMGAFATSFCTGDRIRYLCGLDGRLDTGSVASLPLAKTAPASTLLLAVRPDRILLFQWHNGTRLVEQGQNPQTFLLPTAVTRPALLLEPMIANAVCVGGKQKESTPILRTVIEKFGRKAASITHGEDEGIGNLGAGMTPRVFEILRRYELKQAASWLMTGIVQFDRSANTTILPPWHPIAPKAKAALNSDAFLHLIANGDQYFHDYVKAPDQGMASTLPRPSDSAAYICREFAHDALKQGKTFDAFKTLDIAGAESTESLVLQLALVLETDHSKDATSLLKSLCGYDDSGFSRSSAPVKTPASLAALAVSLKLNKGGGPAMNEQQVDRWMKPLAPSLQRGTKTTRPRQKILGEEDLSKAGAKKEGDSDPLWVSACNESKHVWNEGPRREKDRLLMLDRMEDWLGRRRPAILGKEGASAARDRGGGALADILNQDDDSFGGKSDLESEKDGWVDGIGEGRSDEANLSGYFRMSEGDDEDSPWRSEGLVDLSPHQNKALVVGDAEAYTLEPSTSSVDEGEPGKVKSLYDFVFQNSVQGTPSGLALSAARGGSLDVGMMHGRDRPSRQRCSIELWFYLPSGDTVSDETILVRRTMGPSADDFSKVCLASDKEASLWELVLRRSGELEFRSCGGSKLLSTSRYDPDEDADDSDDEKERQDLAMFERWNHFCLVFSSRDLDVTQCSVSLYMKGNEVASSEVSLLPPGFTTRELENTSNLDELMQKSHLVFGLNGAAGMRFTELRVWACERSADDTQSFMYEYLNAAETKKKFKVKIKNNKGKGGLLAPPTGGLLAPAGGAAKKGLLGGPKAGGLSQPKKFSLAPMRSLAPAKSGMLTGMRPPAAAATAASSLAPPPPPPPPPKSPPKADDKFGFPPPASTTEKTDTQAAFDTTFTAFGEQEPAKKGDRKPVPETPTAEEIEQEPSVSAHEPEPEPEHEPYPEEYPEEYDEEEEAVTLWDTALPLSQQIRSSAASALIRGPPATRHFGGNRGGLPDFSGMERFGVGGIAICGSEKTIVWRDNEDPPALTYPIGASGAIVSDHMDDEGSEFLCCFLAKEKRMVVFELQSRTVVVELQMTTKLNFWRFVPPEASENTLCFVLVTPVGGFHWMPLEESPRPRQIWKRGPELQGKKVVNYEEGGSNGLDGPDIMSKLGLVMVTKTSDGGTLEAWLVPVCGDSKAVMVFEDVMGACLCQPPVYDEDEPFLPLLVTAHHEDEGIYVNVLSVSEPTPGTIELGSVEGTQEVDMIGYEDVDYEPPTLAMGTFPEAICCSMANIVVVVVRRKGLIVAFELEDGDISLIAQEDVGHYVIDAVMRYSAEVGGAEVVMLLSDTENPKDGRMVSFCFRSAV